jgi:gliding motility-associated-like protein
MNDTTVKVKFKKAWQGYVYAYSNSCGNLLDSFFVKVFPPPAPLYLGRDTTFCSPVNLSAGTGFINYSWQDNSSNNNFTVTGPGKYFVSATDNCGNTFSDSIIFYPRKENVFLGNDTCVVFPYTISADTGFQSYLWQNGSLSRQVTVTTPGLYYITTKNICNESYSDSIYLYKRAELFSLGNDSFLCSGSSIRLQAPAGYPVYTWQNGSTDDFYDVNVPGRYYVAITDACGNRSTDTIEIRDPGYNFKVTAQSPVICKEEKISLRAKEGFTNYTWTPAYNISNTNAQMVWVNPEISTWYTVTAEKYPGCTVKDSVLITVKDCPQSFYMPGAFTPNNDGLNDNIAPAITGALESFQFVIYNRWGEIVFKSNSPSANWDGKYKGTGQPTGSFVWMCNYKFYGKPAIFKKGAFMLIR